MPGRSLHIAVLLAFSLFGGVIADGEFNYVDSGQWTFNKDVIADGDVIFTSMTYGVQAWSVSDPDLPLMLGDFYIPEHRPWAVDLTGDLLGVTTATGHLFLLDVSDPANMVQVGDVSGLGADPDICFREEGFALIGYFAGSSGLRIKDLSDPAAPIDLGELSLGGTPNSVALLGDYALVLAKSWGLYIVDVGDSSNPQLVSSLELDGSKLLRVDADGARCAVAARTNGVHLIDIGDIEAPALISTFLPDLGDGNGELSVKDLVLDGSTLHLCCDLSALAIFDVSDMANPVLEAHEPDIDWYTFERFHLESDRAYLCHWDGVKPGCAVIDLSNPAAPLARGFTAAYDYCRYVDVEDGLVYGCTGHQGVFVHDHGSPYDLLEVGNLVVSPTWGIMVLGSTAYIASTNRGLVIADFSDPAAPVELGELDTGQGRAVLVDGSVAYVASYTQGLASVDVSDPAAPVMLDEDDSLPDMQSLALSLSGNILASADGAGGTHLWDVADPSNLVLLSEIPVSESKKSNDVDFCEDYLYVAVPAEGIYIYNTSDPATPTQVAAISGPGRACYLDSSGYFMHVAEGNQGVTTYEVSDPAAPVEWTSYNSVGTTYAVAQEGEYVYLADYSGLTALHFDADSPVFLASFHLDWDGSQLRARWQTETPGAEFRLVAARIAPSSSAEEEVLVVETSPGEFSSSISAQAGETWRCALHSRLPGEPWQMQREESIVLGSSPAAQHLALAAWPNPFNPQVTLSFEMPTAGLARLDIYSSSGRHLRQVAEEQLPAGASTFTWDGRDAHGTAVGSGAYLARLRTEAGASSIKLMLLR